MFQQAAVVDDVEGEVRQWAEVDFLPGGFVLDYAALVVDLQLVAVVYFFECVRRFDEVEAVVDGVAIEDSGEGFGDHRLNARAVDRPDRVLSRGAAAKILARNNTIARLDLIHEVLIQILQAMPRQFGPVVRIQIPSRDDFVRIDMIPIVYVCYIHFYNLTMSLFSFAF